MKKVSGTKMTQALARFAEFANVGGNRTGGFGVVRSALKS
jgi:CRISPR/Cas system endoribonuclease Cas6 (RAMP superfamily)